MIKDYFVLAFTNLRQRGLRSWLTMLGIFIGIAALVSLISLGTSLQQAVIGQFGTLSVDTLTIQNKGAGFGPPGSTVVEKLNKEDLELIKNTRGVERAIPRILRAVKIEYNDISNFGYVIDLPLEQKNINFVYDSFNLETEKGQKIEQGDQREVLLGNSVAEGRQFDKEIDIRKKLKIEKKEFEVKGIIKKSSSFQLNNVIFMPREELEDLLNIKKEYDFIVVQVEDKNRVEETAKRIEEKLRKDRNENIGKESFSVETPLQSLESVNTILNIINLIIAGIAGISLFVGGIGITNTMYTSVIERTKEIGTMKAIGAQNKDILSIFLIESGLLGLAGGIIGVILGFGISKSIELIAINILNTDLLKAAAPLYLIFGCFGFGFLIGAISGMLPALQASKTNVVDALRYE